MAHKAVWSGVCFCRLPGRLLSWIVLFLIGGSAYGFLSSGFAQGGATYYVAPTGSDTNPGTSAAPWRTIQKAANTLHGGDTVIVKAGTYNGRVQVLASGSAGQLLNFQAQANVVMQGFNIQADYVRVNGFEITNTPGSSPTDYTNGSGVYTSGNYNEISDNYVHHTTAAGIFLDSSTSNTTVSGNRVAYAVECGIFIQGNNHLIVSNDISHTRSVNDSGADGIRFFGSANTVRKNYIHDLLVSDSPGESPYPDALASWGPATNYIFERNLIDKDSSQHHGFNINAWVQPVGGIIIRNNVFISRGDGYNPDVIAGVGGGTMTNLTIVNNTMAAVNGPAENAVWLFANVRGAIVKNNALYDRGTSSVPYILVESGASGVAIGFNSVSKSDAQAPNGSPYPGDLWMVNPLFVNLAGCDFHLQSASPLINKGTSLAQVTNDYDGIARPQGSGYDIGAFETIVVTPPTITGFTPASGPVGTSVTISGTNFSGATAVRFNGVGATFMVNSATSIQATVPAGATTGPISVITPGGTATSGTNFTITNPPTITSFTPAGGVVGTSVTISGTNFTGATAVRFNGVSSTFTVNSATSIQATVPATATSGPVSVTTPAGTASSGSSFTVMSPPTITSFAPTMGPVATSVSISGTNFSDATAVQFNGAGAAFTVNSPTSIQATVPATATSGPISVTTPAGTVTSTSSFTVLNPPTITSFTPTMGPVSASVSITGTDFSGATAVQFNGAGAAFTVNSPTSIQATVPAGATTGPISVTTPAGTGTSSTPFKPATRLEDTDPAVTITSGWDRSTTRPWSGGTALAASAAGEQATFTFTGTDLRWIGFRGPQAGIARVSLDGVFIQQIDFYSTAEEIQAEVFKTTGLASGSHTLTIEVTGTKNPDSTFTYVVVDAFDVAPQVTGMVSISSPPPGAPVSGTIMITVNASGGTIAGVQYRLDGANLGAEVTAAPYSISWDTTTAGSASHTLTAVARFAAGNTATSSPVGVTVFNSPPGQTRFEDTDSSVTFNAGWTSDNGLRAWSGGSAMLSATAGARATFTFSGTSAYWIGFRGPQAGIARVYVDGIVASDIDAYSSFEQVQATLFQATGLAAGTHTLTIEVTGTRNPASTDSFVVVDAFD